MLDVSVYGVVGNGSDIVMVLAEISWTQRDLAAIKALYPAQRDLAPRPASFYMFILIFPPTEILANIFKEKVKELSRRLSG